MVFPKIKKHLSILLIRLNQKTELRRMSQERNKNLDLVMESFLDLKYGKNIEKYLEVFKKCEEYRTHLLHDNRVILVSFTGSTEVGRKLLKVASDQVLKTSMELGGNAPLIVFDDADMETAVDGCMVAKIRNLGEACTDANRIYVHENVAEEFKDKFSQRMGSLKVGNGLDKTVDVGPLVNAETRDKVAYFVKDAIEKGAELSVGGESIDGPGFYYPPTVLFNVPDSSECLNDEIFGPVAAIQTFKDTEDVITRAIIQNMVLLLMFLQKI